MSKPFTLLSSPLQGFTDFRFRNAFHKFFGGIDTFYAPYIRFNGKLEIKSSYQRDLEPENNTVPELIPQVMTADAEEFLLAANYIRSLGYKELNWNLGCPYPMVTKRGMGSGLICNHEQIDHILERVHAETDVVVSMKMRMGYEHAGDILETFETLEKYPLKSIAIHARTGKQLYKGGVDLEAFQKCVDRAKQKLYYNGDITSVSIFKERQDRFPSIDHFMIGRGLIADPWLPYMIQNNLSAYPADRWERFREFHDTIYADYDAFLQGPTPIKMKMQGFWGYFAEQFDNPQKTMKKIKKAGGSRNYVTAVNEILNSVK
ncbi:tRNA dihydrouridine synthase [Nonlabens marinus]|uniref:tRNA-dihydrouridine synthase n=1 Tax=Nonlabens marinus S1-08 TaxID=1454201 RepID=W8W0G4_9FLAO|nr:tRNA-dihydrouridine synthase family protein [Nonlabens marinus]BAO56281.1 probable transcriptional regulator [Nonlabens marinus S1-08]